MIMKKCPHCGSLQPSDASFCQDCGKKIPVSGLVFAGKDDKKNTPAKTFPVIGAAIIAALIIIALLVIILVTSKLSKSTSSTASAGEESAVSETAETETSASETSASETESEVVSVASDEGTGSQAVDQEVMEEVNRIDKYVNSIANNSSLTTVSYYEGTAYYLDGSLVRFTETLESQHIEYYYDGYPRYASTNGKKAYFVQGRLICWIDSAGTYHTDDDSDEAQEMQDLTTYGGNYNYMYGDQPESADSEFIFPDSDTVLLSASEVEGLDAWSARIARNEICARHGRKFNDEQLRAYFLSCSWYEETMEADYFDDHYDDILSETERKNIDTIKQYETEMGYLN